jgi:hypothetical protein
MLNIIGLICGFAGTVVVWKYGIPAIDVLSEASYTEIQITDEMRQYTRLSRLGLGLIAFGFLLQLFAALWGLRPA